MHIRFTFSMVYSDGIVQASFGGFNWQLVTQPSKDMS